MTPSFLIGFATLCGAILDVCGVVGWAKSKVKTILKKEVKAWEKDYAAYLADLKKNIFLPKFL